MGCDKSPTKRSVVDGQRNSILDGAIKIRAFPRTAVMDRKMFSPESHVS